MITLDLTPMTVHDCVDIGGAKIGMARIAMIRASRNRNGRQPTYFPSREVVNQSGAEFFRGGAFKKPATSPS